MKNEAEEARIQTAKFDHELKACEKKGREFEQAMRALDEKIQKSNAELNRIHNHPVRQRNIPNWILVVLSDCSMCS